MLICQFWLAENIIVHLANIINLFRLYILTKSCRKRFEFSCSEETKALNFLALFLFFTKPILSIT